MNIPFQSPSMAEICTKFPCDPDVAALATEYPTPAVFIDKLQAQQKSPEAVQALARFLPKEQAVDWAAQSSRLAGEQTALLPEEESALVAVETWVANPNEENRLAAAQAAEALQPQSPAYWTANAATFSEGVDVPEGELPLTSSDDLTAHFSSGAVLLAAAKTSPGGVPEISDVPPLPDMAIAAAEPPENPLAQALERSTATPQPPAMEPEQRAEVSKTLEPFLKLGTDLAQSVPGWFGTV